jgi:hypothetical protein
MNPPASPGKSWPLLVMAGLAFIPFLGVLFGFIATCWGLVTDRPRGLIAAAIGGAGALLNIFGIVVFGMSLMKNNPAFGGLSAGIARVELDSLESRIEEYQAQHGRYPEELAQLPRAGTSASVPIIDHSTSLLNVTVRYQYRVGSDGQSYELFGAGPDGVADTPDDVLPTSRRVRNDTIPDSAVDSAATEE